MQVSTVEDFSRQQQSHTDDGTNDLMNLSILRGIGRRKASAQCGGEVLLDGLEGAN